jgi:hypothetical protein
VRGARYREAGQRLARAEHAVEAAEARVATPKSSPPPRSTPALSPPEIAQGESLLSQARAELAERDAALHESERLYRAGAASAAECREDAEALAAAAARRL